MMSMMRMMTIMRMAVGVMTAKERVPAHNSITVKYDDFNAVDTCYGKIQADTCPYKRRFPMKKSFKT